MAKVVYNINGNPVSSEFAGSNIALLPKQSLNVNKENGGNLLHTVITDNQGNEVLSNLRRTEFSNTQDEVVLNPLEDAFPLKTRLLEVEYYQGDPLPVNPRTVLYSFYQPFGVSNSQTVNGNIFVKEISTDKTEIRVGQIGTTTITSFANSLQVALSSELYFPVLKLQIDGRFTNVQVLNVLTKGNEVYLKLHRPANEQIAVNSRIEIFEEIAEPIQYTITVNITPDIEVQQFLREANFNIELEDSSEVTTEYLDYSDLHNISVTSSNFAILSNLDTNKISINVDYTDYENFVHFSSATERLANFKYKLGLLETYTAEKNNVRSISSASLAISSSDTYYDNLITEIVSKFDGYEQYLYYESSSKAWPKSNSTKPYINVSSSLTAATNWYATQSLSASLYDELNESGLEYTIPEFIRQDNANVPYLLLTNMIGQHFDDLWLYAKDYTNKYNADNRLDFGISKDLVAKTLQSFGVKLYSSNFAVGNLTSLLLGEWYDSGSETITNFVTASNTPTPDSDILDETYKRVYHNLPYLIKTKGTERGLRALVNAFGIPSSSLDIKTFGGVERPGGTPYFASAYPTGSHIRLDNTGSIIPGSTLSQFISIQKGDNKFTQDQHIIEAGFSPAYSINDYILDNVTGSFNIDQYIGDPRYLYSANYANDTNGNLYKVAEDLLSGSDAYDLFDYVRLIKFFDNQLFKMVKDFVPARDVSTSGIIIKPHILDRSKVKATQATWTRPEYSSSIDTAFVTGSDGGVIDQASTAYTASIPGLLGTVYQIQDTEVEKINGELGGSTLTLYTGSLNKDNTLKTSPNAPVLLYTSSGSGQTTPPEGEFFWRYGNVIGSGGAITGTQVKSIYINEVDQNGVNIEAALSNLKPGDKITFTIKYTNLGEPAE